MRWTGDASPASRNQDRRTAKEASPPEADISTHLEMKRLGMFYKAARSRAQANGKVGLNHCSTRHLKGEEAKRCHLRRSDGRMAGSRERPRDAWLLQVKHLWSHVSRCPSNSLWDPSKCVLTSAWRTFNIFNTTSNRLVLVKQAQSVTEILLRRTRTFLS